MPRITCYLLACTMVLTTTMGMDPERPRCPWDIGQQCKNRGHYAGACMDLNERESNWELTCRTLMCASEQNDGSYIAVPTGPMDNGTQCGPFKYCENGACVSKDPPDIFCPAILAPLKCDSPMDWDEDASAPDSSFPTDQPSLKRQLFTGRQLSRSEPPASKRRH